MKHNQGAPTLFDGLPFNNSLEKIHESGNKLNPDDKSRVVASGNNQRSIVKNFFNRFPGNRYTAEQVHDRVLNHAPLTSCRRTLTNLMNEGFLEKDEETKRIGSYGVKCVTYFKPIKN